MIAKTRKGASTYSLKLTPNPASATLDVEVTFSAPTAAALHALNNAPVTFTLTRAQLTPLVMKMMGMG